MFSLILNSFFLMGLNEIDAVQGCLIFQLNHMYDCLKISYKLNFIQLNLS